MTKRSIDAHKILDLVMRRQGYELFLIPLGELERILVPAILTCHSRSRYFQQARFGTVPPISHDLVLSYHHPSIGKFNATSPMYHALIA